MTVRPRVLVCGWSGAGNIGDELLTQVVVERLRSIGADPIVRSADPEATGAVHDDVAVTDPRGAFRAAWSADAVVFGPGGIVQDHTSVWSLPGHLAPVLVARLRRRRIIGIGLGADPLRRRLSRLLLRLALGRSTVVVRDERSVAAMADAGVTASIDLDLAWELPTPPSGARSGIVVAIGPLPGEGALLPGRRRLEAEDAGPVVEALRSLASRVPGPIRFVSFRGERDETVARTLAAELVGAEVVPASDAVVALRDAAVVVTSRYHAALLAVAAGIPVFADIRQGKLAALAATDELSGRIVGFDDWSALDTDIPVVDAGLRRTSTGATDAALASLGCTPRSGGG